MDELARAWNALGGGRGRFRAGGTNGRQMTGKPLLEMRGISKRFPGVVALDQVSLEVGRGEVVALVGENGAGKSTLMKILGGVYQPDDGEIRVDGREVRIQNVTDAMRAGVGFIHQELNVLDNLDVAGNVFLGREPVKTPFRLIDRRKIHADTEPILKRLGLDISSRTRVGRLSIAQQQMVEIAKALSLNSKLIIMDEPTSSSHALGNEPPAGAGLRTQQPGRQHYLYLASTRGD